MLVRHAASSSAVISQRAILRRDVLRGRVQRVAEPQEVHLHGAEVCPDPSIRTVHDQERNHRDANGPVNDGTLSRAGGEEREERDGASEPQEGEEYRSRGPAHLKRAELRELLVVHEIQRMRAVNPHEKRLRSFERRQRRGAAEPNRAIDVVRADELRELVMEPIELHLTLQPERGDGEHRGEHRQCGDAYGKDFVHVPSICSR